VSDPAAVRHLVKLSGLQPGTEYRYVATVGTARAEGTFFTAPAPGAAGPFSFAVVGDARDHAQWATVAQGVLGKHPRFVLTTGDAVGFDSDAAWRDYYAAAAPLFASTPVFAVSGNHDVGGGFAAYNPAPASTSHSPDWYAFAYGPAAFVAIDTNQAEGAQAPWLKATLQSVKGGPLFVFHHHPLYSCGAHGSNPQLQQWLQPLLEAAQVTTDFAGHDHDLIYWSPINGVRYVVSGGGGTVLYPLGDCQIPFALRSYGFMLVTVDGAHITEAFYDAHGTLLYAVPAFDAAGAAAPAAALQALSGAAAK
jgi:hypothetical protein